MRTILCGLMFVIVAPGAYALDWAAICSDPMSKIMYQAECLQYSLSGEVRRDETPGDGPVSESEGRPVIGPDYKGNGEAPCAGPAEACGGGSLYRDPLNNGDRSEAFALKQKRDELVEVLYDLQDRRYEASSYQEWYRVEEIDYQIATVHEQISEIDYQLNQLRAGGPNSDW